MYHPTRAWLDTRYTVFVANKILLDVDRLAFCGLGDKDSCPQDCKYINREPVTQTNFFIHKGACLRPFKSVDEMNDG